MRSPNIAPLLAAVIALGVLTRFGDAMTPSQTDKRPQAPVFGASTELVLIDLIATDRSGQLVRDLRPDEILVFENGRPQGLEFLRLVSTPGATGTPRTESPGAAVSMPRITARPEMPSALASASAPSLVVVVDVYATPPESLILARQAIVSMAREQVEPGTRLTLVTLDRGLQIRQPFTDEVETFSAAVEALKPSSANAEGNLAALVDDVNRSCDGTTQGGMDNALTLAKVYLQNSKQGTTAALEGLAALNRHLASAPGRKHLIFYSPGYAMRPSAMVAEIIDSACGAGGGGLGMSGAYTALGGHDLDSTRLLRAIVEEANRAQVSFYTVDARGLGGPGSEAVPSAAVAVTTRMVSEGRLQRVQRASHNAPQEILRALAQDTGGVASMNSNDLGRGMKTAAADSRGYYMVAYTPPADRKRGRFYEIELKTSRPGLSLRYRKGYEWLSDEDRAERALAHAILFPELHAEDGLAIEARVEAGSLKIVTLLPTRSLTFHEEGGRLRNDIELQGVLRDSKGKTVGKRFFFARKVQMKLSSAGHEDLLTNENVEIVSDAKPPKKGRYQLTVVASHSGGRLTSATTAIEVP
jgi:VWFA-related protein